MLESFELSAVLPVDNISTFKDFLPSRLIVQRVAMRKKCE